MEIYKKCVQNEVYGGMACTFMQKYNLKHVNPSTNAVYLIRKMQLWYRRSGSSNAIVRKISSFNWNRIYRMLATRYGIFINPNLEIGLGLKLPHPNGIIIGAERIGSNVKIYQQVTIGSAHIGDYLGGGKQPVICDNVVLFSGAKIIGQITVHDGAHVGAGAVLTKSADRDSIYAGVPAKKIR